MLWNVEILMRHQKGFGSIVQMIEKLESCKRQIT